MITPSLKKPKPQRHNGISTKAIFFFGFIIILFLTCFIVQIRFLPMTITSSEITVTQKNKITSITKGISPSAYRQVIQNVEIFVQTPYQDFEIEGIVLLFHGCSRDGKDWIRLPEDKRIMDYLTSEKRKLAAVAISSHDREQSRCWSSTLPTSQNIDVINVKKILPSIYKDLLGDDTNSMGIPLYAIGASSGGSFVPILMLEIPLKGMVCMISPGTPAAFQMHKPPYPKTAFVYMPRDQTFGSESNIKNSISIMNQKDPSTNVQLYSCDPKPVTASWLYEKMVPHLSIEQTETILEILQTPPMDLIDPITGDVQRNPREKQSLMESLSLWNEVDFSSGSGKEVFFISLGEILNIAYGQHEMTSEHIEEVFDFLTSKHDSNIIDNS